jgi:hypothetical protein
VSAEVIVLTGPRETDLVAPEAEEEAPQEPQKPPVAEASAPQEPPAAPQRRYSLQPRRAPGDRYAVHAALQAPADEPAAEGEAQNDAAVARLCPRAPSTCEQVLACPAALHWRQEVFYAWRDCSDAAWHGMVPGV